MWNSIVTLIHGDMITLILKGGLIMIPLLGASLVAVTVIVERLYYWRRLRAHGDVGVDSRKVHAEPITA